MIDDVLVGDRTGCFGFVDESAHLVVGQALDLRGDLLSESTVVFQLPLAVVKPGTVDFSACIEQSLNAHRSGGHGEIRVRGFSQGPKHSNLPLRRERLRYKSDFKDFRGFRFNELPGFNFRSGLDRLTPFPVRLIRSVVHTIIRHRLQGFRLYKFIFGVVPMKFIGLFRT